jgi:hypothetical protein
MNELEREVTMGDPVDPEPEVEQDDSYEDLERFFADDDDDDEVEETEEEVAEEPVSEEATEEDVALEETVQDAKSEERLFTQEELNQIIGSARIQGRELNEKVEMLQHMTGGMNIDQIIDHLRSQQTQQYESEYGLPPEKAQEFVEDKTVRRYLEKELRTLHEQQQVTAAMAGYNNEKAKFLSNPLAKKYEAEIDEVSQGGRRMGFEAAMRFVLGGKAYEGEITKNIQEATQQRAIKEAGKKPTVTPEGAGSGGAPTQSIPPDLKRMAALFGNDPKSVAKQYQKIQRTQR